MLHSPTPDAPSATPRDAAAPSDGPRRPRIAIMGEFSAGKSTLTNLLMGADALPVKVTATQLPPVWLSHGEAPPHGVRLSGERFEVDLARPETIPLDDTAWLGVQRPVDVLEMCDIIDFPGISDPNMSAEVWQRAVPLADAVLWCTHATQAWRQTEAAVWEDMPERLRANSLLLLTRMDRLGEPRDRRRVIARVTRETAGLFAGVFPVSLTRALAAGDDHAAWQASGADALTEALLDMTLRLSRELGAAGRMDALAAQAADPAPRPLSAQRGVTGQRPAAAAMEEASRPAASAAGPVPQDPVPLAHAPEEAAATPGRVVPRRVRAAARPGRSARPTAPTEEVVARALAREV